MGKATILSHLGGAQYSVTVHQDESRLDDMIQAANDMLELLAPELDAAQADYDQALADYLAALAERDDDINLAIPGVPIPEQLARSINEKTSEISEWFDTVAKVEFRLNNIKARILSLEKRVEWLQGLYGIDPIPTTAYCIDLSDGETDPETEITRPLLSGDVGTIEPFHRGDNIRLINGNTPSHRADPAYNAAADGAIVPIAAMTPEQFLYNYAMWPGLNAWRPKYHVGIITGKDIPSGPVDVEIQVPNHLSGDGFSRTHTGIPVDYMECDAKAFLVGDWVVVTYDADNTNPRVIGFAQAPRACPVAKDFLVHATTENTYWRLTPDESGNWTKTEVGLIAGPVVWMGKNNKLVSCNYSSSKVFDKGTAYTMSIVDNSPQAARPVMAAYHEDGTGLVIAVYARRISVGNYEPVVSLFEWSGATFTMRKVIQAWGSTMGSVSANDLINNSVPWRARISVDGNQIAVWYQGQDVKDTYVFSIYDVNVVAWTTTAATNIQFTDSPYSPDISWEQTPEEVHAELHDNSFTQTVTIGLEESWSGGFNEVTTDGRLNGFDWEHHIVENNYTELQSFDAEYDAKLWGTTYTQSSIVGDFTGSHIAASTNALWDGTVSGRTANYHAYHPYYKTAIIAGKTGLGGLNDTIRMDLADAVDYAIVVVGGSQVLTLGSTAPTPVAIEDVTGRELRQGYEHAPLTRAPKWGTGELDVPLYRTPIPGIDFAGWITEGKDTGVGSHRYRGYPSNYMYAGADMVGNAVVLDRHTVGGTRVQYLSNGSLSSLFSGFNLDGLRLVGMI